MSLSWQNEPVWMLVATALAAATGTAVLTVGAGHSNADRLYISSTAAKIEIVTTAGLWAAIPSVWIVGLSAFRMVAKRERPVQWDFVTLGVALSLAVAAGAWLAGWYARGSNTGVYLGIWRTSFTYAVATMGAYRCLRAMWSARAAAASISRSSMPSPAGAIAALSQLRSVLVNALVAVGVLVSLGVFAAGAQRQAWEAFSPKNKDAYPAAYVVIMGCAVTLFLMVNFVPPWLGWTSAANAELDARLPSLAPDAAGWQARIGDRTAYAGLLQIPQSARELLSSSVFIVGPLISATISLFIPGGS
ncbi:hypothetical protein [Leekyejoonella antrihumi]|uniref:Uncharacterized protein n=1 Tax=Leekyejoonella antrihumi TaxID=1660198 RepID=A0A563DS67_9MICO|nr:hypothetical protein [Leekyejoonella antrihumi]TWP32823.1 hypothetical protein FGL98_23280 [Leekyejoonella antrihumi]